MRPVRVIVRAVAFFGVIVATTASCAADEPYSLPLDLTSKANSTEGGGPLMSGHDGRMRLVSAHSLEGKRMGGLSALLVEGDAFTAFSDKGFMWTGQISRNADGKITAIEGLIRSQPPSTYYRNTDLESATKTNDGFVLGYERTHTLFTYKGRPDRYAELDGEPYAPAAFKGADANGSIEALATVDGLHARHIRTVL